MRKGQGKEGGRSGKKRNGREGGCRKEKGEREAEVALELEGRYGASQGK